MTDNQIEEVRSGSMLLAAIIDGHQITVDDLTAAEVLPVPADATKAPKVEKNATPAQTTLT